MNTTCVVMVVRNEEYYLQFSLACALRHADSVFVLDTGSTDRTMEMLILAKAQYGARLEFEQKDFGGGYNFEGGSYPTTDPKAYREMDARNYALERAEALFDPDWMVRLDADETFSPLLFEIMRDDQKSSSLRFNCELATFHSPLLIQRPGGQCDPHVFAWNRRMGPGRWSHPPSQHVCLTGPGFHSPRCLNEPVHFHWHRVFGPKSIYTYLWWEASVTYHAKGLVLPGYGDMTSMFPWLNAKNKMDMGLYREHLPEYFAEDGRFRVRYLVQNMFRTVSVPCPDGPVSDDVLTAWKTFLIYE